MAWHDAAMAAAPPELVDLRIDVDGRLGRLTLDRPEKLNPLSTDVLEGIEVAARWFDAQREIAVVVVAGAGRAFSAGADLGSFGERLGDDRTPHQRADAGRRMGDSIEAMRAVTVARLHGNCIGGGVVLASACDLRVAARSTRFSIPEVDLGIPLAWGGVHRLVREIGAAATRDLVMTCRTFDAEEALRLGLVQRVADDSALDDEVDSLVATLLDKPEGALLATKRGVDAVASSMVGIERAWADADVLVAALRDPGFQAAAARYLERLAERRTTSD